MDLLKMIIWLLRAYTKRRFDGSLASNSKGHIKKCVSLNNQLCQDRITPIDINSKEPLYYLLSVSINTCGRRFNTIDDLQLWVCVSNKIENMNAKVFNLMVWISMNPVNVKS